MPQQQSQRNTLLWSPIRQEALLQRQQTEWVSGSEGLRMKRCTTTLLWCPLQQSQNKDLHFEVELWWHRAFKVLCCCVSYCFSILFVHYVSEISHLLWVAGCTTATGVLLECQSRQSVGGIVGIIDHEETDVQSCPDADSNTAADPGKTCVCKLGWFLVGLKLIFIRAIELVHSITAASLFYCHGAEQLCYLSEHKRWMSTLSLLFFSPPSQNNFVTIILCLKSCLPR